MKIFTILIWLTTTLFGCKVQAQISRREKCDVINNQTIRECLVQCFGNKWYNAFCESKGKFFFIAEINPNGSIKNITEYSLKSGISEYEFLKFHRKLKENYNLCISNNNPDISDKEFLRLVRNTRFKYVFHHVCI